MITEQYVSFETAKLLKEKGFNEDCHSVYRKTLRKNEIIDDEEIHFATFTINNSEIAEKEYSNIIYCIAPTQSLVMRWLREVYGLFIEIHTFYESEELPFACRYQIISNNKDYESMEDESDECFYTYEEAVEAAITECLECYL